MAKRNAQRGFTLAEIMVTLAVMGIVLALVATFTAAASGATRDRTDDAAVLDEIERVNELVSDWFYTFDSTDYKFLNVEVKPEEWKYDFIERTAVNVSPSEFTIQNKKFNEMIDGGIVPMNYQLVFNVDRDAPTRKVITAVYSASNNKSITLKYIKSIAFDYNEELGLLKCTYTYDDPKITGSESNRPESEYTFILSRHTKP